jgi:quercetin dioxygenase-like cupin family protein
MCFSGSLRSRVAASVWFALGVVGLASAAESTVHDAAAQMGPDSGETCIPVAQRGDRELGCYVIDSVVLGTLPNVPLYWYLETYPSQEAAERAQGKYSRVVEAYEKIWLFTIGDNKWKSTGGQHIRRIGPLPLRAGASYKAEYMQATFVPGMRSAVHRHPGPEAWYVLTGAQCLETPGHRTIMRAGETGIVPEGPPMMLSAIGTSKRQSLVLILHDSSKPMGALAPDWKPSGLCAETTGP